MTRQEWLEARKRGIGGSDWQHVLNLAPYGCARRCYYDKVGQEPDYLVDDDKGVLRRGTLLEPFVVDEFERVTDRITYQPPSDDRGMLLARVPTLPEWWLGTPDAMIEDAGEGHDGVLECKTSSPWVFAKILREGVPQSTLAQRMHYLALTGANWGVVAYLDVSSWKLLPVPFERDDEMIKLMLAAGEKFWQKVLDGTPPERLDAADARCKDCPFFPTCQGELLWAGHEGSGSGDYEESDDVEVDSLVLKRTELKRIAKDTEAMLTEIEEQLVEKLGEGSATALPSGKVRISDGIYTRTDYKAMAKAHPKIFSENNLKKFKVSKKGKSSIRIYPTKGA